MEKINANKTNLNKIIKWSSSRFNEYTKSEAIQIFLELIEKENDIVREIGTGSFAPSGGLGGWRYILQIKDKKNILIEKPSNKKWILIKK